MLTSERPNIQRTGRYPIGEAAQLLGITRKTLQRWVKNGEVSCRYRRNGRKVFCGYELIDFWEREMG